MKHFKLSFPNSFAKRFCLFIAFILSIHVCAVAQTSDELANVKVEELTDQQIRSFIVEADRLNLKDEQVEQLALSRGMNPVELVKFKLRIQSVRKAMTAANANALQEQTKPNPQSRQLDSISNIEQKPLEDYNSVFNPLQAKNFGFNVFNNRRITFEPNLRIPTPKNYQLAADDELLIDVSGYSEANYRLRVSPEGVIRIPVAGPVTVSGLTIEQAKRRITQKLAGTIYTNILGGHTFVDVSLGSIRSMKVTIIGEATVPGTYTLPSLASAYNALYGCGGPNANGSFRNIEVIRNNETVATIDVYQFLVNGSKNNDIRLMDDDVIKINTYEVRIELKGEVKKPGLYDVKNGETLAQIIDYAGGFTDNAYAARIQVFKNTSKEREVTTITQNSLSNITPQKGDTYVIGKILNRFANRISINGAVYRPGEYELKQGMTLQQLINEADGLREDAFTMRATLHRLKEDLSPEIISFDLEQLLSGKTDDIKLKREDRINIFSKFDLKEGYYVTIEGEVSNPGTFIYEEGITVQDLVLMSGGLKESASLNRVEISRRVKNTSSDTLNKKTAIIYQQDINLNLNGGAAGDTSLILEPFDEVVIHPAPGYYVQKNAVIEGEVLYQGKYTIEAKSDRISDLIKRSGGLTPEAYLKGAVLVRTKNLTRTEQNNSEQGLINLLKQNYESGTSPALLQTQLEFYTRKKSENVGIDLQRIIDNPKSEYDLLLNDGDTLRIPKQLQTVRVNGEVLYPALVRYDKNFSFKDYISGAGGYSERSAKKRPYVVYANGSVKGTHSFLFFKSYPKLSPGAEIFVPVKRERERLRTGELITVGATVVTMLAIIYNIFGK
ncbi:MAG TPA: SLBB domain-containing protein [Chitinophagaceae bacterium]|nr:SLBB domain-containing protein [Chitinophagaceae bacterium]